MQNATGKKKKSDSSTALKLHLREQQMPDFSYQISYSLLAWCHKHDTMSRKSEVYLNKYISAWLRGLVMLVIICVWYTNNGSFIIWSFIWKSSESFSTCKKMPQKSDPERDRWLHQLLLLVSQLNIENKFKLFFKYCSSIPRHKWRHK